MPHLTTRHTVPARTCLMPACPILACPILETLETLETRERPTHDYLVGERLLAPLHHTTITRNVPASVKATALALYLRSLVQPLVSQLL
jgi:hypothetical protein